MRNTIDGGRSSRAYYVVGQVTNPERRLQLPPSAWRVYFFEGDDMAIQPYLFFDGRCEEAIEFYTKAVGAQVQMMMRFKDSPEPHQGGMPPGAENKVMHATLQIAGSTVLMSDGNCQGKPAFEGFALSLTVASEAEAEKSFNALVDGGAVTMPLAKTFFSPKFGMLRDRFGVHWMVYVQRGE